ncbi:MAG: hypothetical protein ABJO71_03655 [Pseudoruegeria sp.]
MSLQYVNIEEDAATAAVTLDALSGNVLVLAGVVKSDAETNFDSYVASSSLSGVTGDLQFLGQSVYIRFCWECDLGEGQDEALPLEWDHIFIEDKLFPPKDLTDVMERRIAVTTALRDIPDAPVALYDFTADSLPSGVTLTRASTATYWDATPSLQTAAIDVARFEGGALLLEDAGNNFVRNSEDMTAATWPAVNVVATPLGLQAGLAFFTLENLSAGQSYIGDQHAGITFTVGDVVIASAYFRHNPETVSAGTRLRIHSVGTMRVGSFVDIDTDTLVAIKGVGVDALPEIESVGDGIYRASFQITADSDGYAYIRVMMLDDNGHPDVAGHKIDVAGCQLELASAATSYGPTTGATASRAADVPAINGPSGTYDIRVTYDDDSTEDLLSEVIGAAYWPASLNRNRIKSINVQEVGEL